VASWFEENAPAQEDVSPPEEENWFLKNAPAYSETGAAMDVAPTPATPFLTGKFLPPEGPARDITGLPSPEQPTTPEQIFPVPAPISPGNIDLTTRPVVQNEDGTISTEQSFSIGTDIGEVLIPKVVDGKVVNKEEATKHFKDTGEHLGIFETPEQADAYASVLSQYQADKYQPVDWTTGAGHSQLPFGFIPTDDGQMMNVRTGVKVPLETEARAYGAPLPLQTGAKTAVETGLSYVPPLFAARKFLPESSRIRQGVEGAISGTGALVEGLAGPENLALLAGLGFGGSSIPPIASRVISGYFAAQMAGEVPHLWTAFKQARGFKEKVAIVTQAVATIGLTGVATKHAISETPIPGAVSPAKTPRVRISKEQPKVPTGVPVAEAPIKRATPPAAPTVQPAEAPILGGPGTPAATEIPEPRVTGLRNRIVDEERAKRGWLPLMEPARQANPETWNKAMEVLERSESAGTQMVDDIRDGRKKSVDAVDHAILTHERIRVMNESAMEAERASDLHMTEQERDEARVRWGILEDRLNEVDQALREAGTVTARSLQFRNALIRDDYTFEGMARKARAQKGGPLSFEESQQIQKDADEISKAEAAAVTREAKVSEQKAMDEAKDELSATRERTSRTPKPASLDGQHAKLLTAITEHVREGGDLSGLRPLIQKLAENYVRRGINTLQPLTRALHETLSKIIPGITPIEVRNLFSGYGEFRPLNKDAIQVTLRDLRGQAQQAGKIADMMKKVAPKKTGPERRTPTEHERRLTKLVNELKKKGGYAVTDPATQLKSTLGAIKTNLRNQIADLTRQLFTGERPAEKGAIEYDVETEKLRALRDQVKQTLRDVTDNTLTPEQRLAAATKASERNLDYWNERLRLAKQGVFKIDRETGKPISDPQLDAMRARIKAVKEEVDALKQQANPLKTPEQKALASYQARLFNRMADLQDRIAKGDFAPRPRKQITLDKETLELKAQAERLKRQFDRGLAKKRLADRTRWEKALDGLSKWRRAFVLSWPTVLGKLTTASSYLIGSAPLEEALRTPLRYALPRIAEKALRYGRGFHLETEVGALVHTFKTLFSAAGKKWKTGEADIDALYGDPKKLPAELKELIGNLHGALKEPARQNEFFRSFQARLWHEGKKGADVTDPVVQTKIATQAYKDANAQIFQENNMVADFVSRGLSRFRQVSKETGRPSVAGKLAETAVKYELPIIKIPLNLIKRTFEYSFGVGTGTVRLAGALIKGLDKLSPDQADLIMRNLSRGQVGLAFMAYGYFNPTQFGGYYQRGEKRDPEDIAAGHARVLGLDIPSYLVHSPLLAQFQIGATIRRIVDGNVTGKEKDSPGYAKAIQQAYAGVIQETPLVRMAEDSLRALDIRERDRFYGQLMQSTVPGAVEWTAKHFDSDANGDLIVRKPTTPVEFWKQAVPVLRQQVPTKEEYEQEKKLQRRFGAG
jgi:hypothetical protein